MVQWWQLWPQFFTAEECQEITKVGLEHQPTEGRIFSDEQDGATHTAKKFRRSTVRWMDRRNHTIKWIMDRLEHGFLTANCKAFQFDLTYFHEVQFTEYNGEEEGKYDWHEDLIWSSRACSQRKLSIIAQLSRTNDYAGGDVEIDEEKVGGTSQLPDSETLREQGSIFVFPSFLRHRVTPVLQGTRYSLVSWYEGPAFR